MARACCIYKHVLQIQLEASLTAKPNKCLFRFRELDCLVYVLVNGEIHPIQEKIDAITKYQHHKQRHKYVLLLR